MAIRYALVAPNGECAHIITPGIPGLYADRDIVDGYLVVHIDSETPDAEFIENKYWDNGWKNRDPQPSRFYFWTNKQWNFNKEGFLTEVRAIRNSRLARCDWTQMPDVKLTEAQKGIWKLYRQKLRDITNNLQGLDHTDDIVWPKSPED